MSMTIARRIGEWAASLRYEQLPPEAVHEAKRRVLDSIGCALGAFGAAPSRITRELAETVSGGASLLGRRRRTIAPLAALHNGAMVRYLDYNDTYLGKEPAHPSDNIPAAWAAAQVIGGGGREVILGTVIGYEVQCRLCDAASLRAHGWDHVYYGALSTAVLAGRLWGLSPEQIEHALGIAGVCNIATRQTRTGQLSMWKACAFSNAARNGLFAAELARRGMTGPEKIFEGPRGIFRQLTGEFELPPLATTEDFMINRTYIKYWPAEYHSQSAIEAMLAIRDQIGGPENVESIEIESFEAAVSIIGSEPEKWRPTSRETADHSLPYCVACALVDGDVTRESFEPERYSDPKMHALLDRIRIREREDLTAGYPEGIPNHLKVRLKDGRVIEKRVDYPRGHYRNPMTDEEVVGKFERLARGVVSEATARRIMERCFELEKVSDVGELLEFDVLPEAVGAARHGE